jgi:hypothetical protein
MVRRGQCRCGSVLDFENGPEGYKTRCPSCGSVVRLRPRSSKRRPREKSARHGRLAQGVPTARRPASPLDQRTGRTVTCDLCQALVPVEALQCPACGSALAVTTAAPIVEAAPSSPSHRIVGNLPTRPILWGLIAGAALIAASVIVLILALQH